jgi:hypothetical protein
MNDFLNSKSMITPGFAGGVVMLIANALSSQFGLPVKWIVLVASIVLALLIFLLDQTTRLAAKAVACLLNAAIIFSVSVGSNGAITAAKAGATIQSTPPTEAAPLPTPTPFFHPWFEK